MSEVTSSQNVNSSNNGIGGGVDYDSGPYNVTFPVGKTSVLFKVPLNDDNILEESETFTLMIDNPLPNRVTVSNKTPATITIVNTDSK